MRVNVNASCLCSVFYTMQDALRMRMRMVVGVPILRNHSNLGMSICRRLMTGILRRSHLSRFWRVCAAY
jgi:hypothetical protein